MEGCPQSGHICHRSKVEGQLIIRSKVEGRGASNILLCGCMRLYFFSKGVGAYNSFLLMGGDVGKYVPPDPNWVQVYLFLEQPLL